MSEYDVQTDLEDLRRENIRLNLENEELKTALGAYIALVNKKDECMIGLEIERDNLRNLGRVGRLLARLKSRKENARKSNERNG